MEPEVGGSSPPSCTTLFAGRRIGRIPADTAFRLEQAEIVGVLTPSVHALADPTARGMLPFSSLRFPEPLLVDGIDIEGHVLWGMTLRLLDDLIPRMLSGEWEL